MPTINSMMQKNNLLADVSYRYFKLDVNASDKSVLVGAPIRTNADFLKSDFSGQPALTNLVENYSADKEDFQNKIQDRLDSLQESSDKLKDSVQEDEEISATSEDSTSESAETVSSDDKKPGSTLATLGNFAKNNVPPRAKILAFQPVQKKDNDADKTEEIAKQIAERANDRNLNSAKRSQNNISVFAENYLVADKKDDDSQNISAQPPKTAEENILGKVENFVQHYNSVLTYLNEHREMSDRVSALASNFGTNTNLQSALGSIGISVGTGGELSVDGAKLLNALKNDSDVVNVLLGSEGLTGNLDKNLNLANYQNRSDKLFPTIDEYSGEGDFEDWENLYAAQTLTTADYAKQKSGKILNLFS